MQQVTKKNDDGSTCVHLSIKASEVFTETFSAAVQTCVTTTICQKMPQYTDFTERFTVEDIIEECTKKLGDIVSVALARELSKALASIAMDPDSAYEGVFGKDEEEQK